MNTRKVFGYSLIAVIIALVLAGCDTGGPSDTTYKVTFDANGGSGTTPAAQTVNPGSSINLPSGNGLSRSDSTFGGWNTNTSGTGANYAAASSYTPTGAITLYAKWNEEYDHEYKTLVGSEFLNITPANISTVKPVGQNTISIQITDARAGLRAQSDYLQHYPGVGGLEADINYNYANFGGDGECVIKMVKGAHDEIADFLGNGVQLSAYRNAKYLGQRSDMGQGDLNDVLQGLQGIRSVCAQLGITVPAVGSKVKTESDIKEITSEIQGLIMALENQLVNMPEITNVYGGLDLVQQLGDFAKFAGWTDAVLATPGMYPCSSSHDAAKSRRDWEAAGSQFVGLPVPDPTITTASLPNGREGSAYSQTLATTGVTLITWSIESGALPTGLSLSGNTIAGTPTAAGTSNFTVKSDNGVGSDTMGLSITITPSAASMDEAIPLTANQWAAGSLPTSSDVQWFTFTATASTQYIHIERGTLSSASVQVYDSSGATVGQEGYVFGPDNPRTLTTGETYSIRVRPSNSGNSGDYRIAFTTTVYPPDTTLTTLTENQWAEGNITTQPRPPRQWFTFTATAQGHRIYVEFGTLTALEVIVYDSSGAAVNSYTNLWGDTGNTKYISRTLTPGQTYYIMVAPYNSINSGTYRIGFTTSSTAPTSSAARE